jgi:5-methylcytosine-specific restriction endonuclease McrA
MIPICFRKKGAVNRLYHILLNVKPTQKNKVEYLKNIRAINKWCLKNISVSGKKYSLPDVIKADYSEIAEIANVYNSRQIKMPKKYKKFIIDTLYKQRFPRKEFVEELQVTVCPYCNRNFVNSTYKRTMCDLDHFYDKETYPILAVSFHNLVPVCHACNHAKASNAISYSPHNTKFNTDDLLSFDFYIGGIDYWVDNKQIGIEIDCSRELESNVQELKLREVYQIHSDIVQECIKKAIMFNPDYMTDLFNTYNGLFESEEELYRIVFGNYMEESSYGKRPLSKLTKDILSKLLIEIYGFNVQ